MKTKKIKKIILYIIASLIALVSVFSCFKGNYTPEPILTPVNVLRPVNSSNNNIISPTGSYEKIYFNTSLNNNELKSIFNNLTYHDTFGYIIYFDNLDGTFISISKPDTNNNSVINYYAINTSDMSLVNRENFLGVTGTPDDPSVAMDWGDFNNPYYIYLDSGIEELDLSSLGYGVIPIGQQNNLLKNLISPEPFLFQGTSDNVSWTSSGLDNPNNIQNIYFNTNLSNSAIKNILDTYVGTTAGTDIFSYTNGGVLVKCHVINNSANAFIQIIGGSTTLYKWVYDSIDTEERLWWYGIDPAIINNGNVITSPQGNALTGFNIYELRALFSSANDFVEQSSGDSYEQGYQDGYQQGQEDGYQDGYSEGETAGYNRGYDNGYRTGVNNVTTNPNEYNLYTYEELQAEYERGLAEADDDAYERGYLDGLDDGASSNINFQYVESVFTLIGNFLNIEILPDIKLSYGLGIVIILSIISIIKMVVK